ncbi:MAG: MOSC N-terminal beta barrel domain-containing protein, partial [Aquihabitans sp.]
MRVSQIWQYPVKSMIGGTVDSAVIEPLGMVGDRTWAVRDMEIGGIRGAKRIGGLMPLAAHYEAEPGGPVRIDLPDGTSVSSTDADVDTRL